MTTVTEPNDGKIECKIDGARVHSIQMHIRDNHPEWTIDKYKEAFPGAPLFSKQALETLKRRKTATAAIEGSMPGSGSGVRRRAMHEVFGFGAVKACMNSRGEPIAVSVFEDHDEESAIYVPDIDPNYVFDIEVTKNILIGFELNRTQYNWGYHGTGKTTGFEQVCARTKRPFLRVQHTLNTEESHILGQYVLRDGATQWQPGPLMTAMIEGFVYCADEYDFAMPPVTAVYQPVLEGKPLIIKEAPPEFRVIKPHANFRFVATGNTNGSGDETGLYQGTQIQNAANYSRFRIVQEIGYMEPKVEAIVISNQAGIDKKDAEKFVQFAVEVRKAFAGGQIGTTISPRELIGAAEIGLVRGGDWRSGIKLGFTARLSRVDRETVDQFAQRIWGGAR